MQPLTIVTLGRQPELGIAELESLYGGQSVQPFGTAALLSVPTEKIDFDRLGGSTRLCKALTQLPSAQWEVIKRHLVESVATHAGYLPEGKLTVGLSVFGVRVDTKELERSLLEIKKRIKVTGRPVRIVPNKQLELNAAQVLHNKLTGKLGWELVVVAHGGRAWLAQTVRVQDIDAYAERDHGRPYRDARVGMLPPKLAQILVNITVGKPDADSALQTPDDTTSQSPMPLLDPFCGTGVVLQEATLMGLDVYGSDLEPRMVQYSIDNLHWIREKYSDQAGNYVRVEQGDAREHHWQRPIMGVAGETYLGQPLTTLPPRDQLKKIVGFVDKLHYDFLRNIGTQIKPGTRLCLAVPAWCMRQATDVNASTFMHLPVLDHLQELGYNQVKFVHAGEHRLIYHRSGQVVARELVVIVKD